MIQPKYNPKEVLKRAKLMMGYDSSKTLTENREIIKEDNIDTATEKAVQKILNSCSARPQSEGTLDAAAIAAAFNKAFNYQTWGFLGGTDDSAWRSQAAIMKKGNFDDLCNVKREFEEGGYGNFAEQLVEELDDEELSELMEAFSAMKYRSDKEAKLSVEKTEQKNINWFKNQYPCIFQSLGNVDQQVRNDQNNYVYILIKGSSGNQYQVFADGRVKKSDGTSTGKKITCQGSKVAFIGESVDKKKIFEQIDDSELVKGNTPTTTPTPSTTPVPRQQYRNCPTGPYKLWCKADAVAKVQGCLGITADGKFGPKTKSVLSAKGFETFTDADVDKICKKEKLVDDVEIQTFDADSKGSIASADQQSNTKTGIS